MKRQSPSVNQQQVSNTTETIRTVSTGARIISITKKAGILVGVGITTVAAQAAASNMLGKPADITTNQPSNSVVQPTRTTPPADNGAGSGSASATNTPTGQPDQVTTSNSNNDVSVQVQSSTTTATGPDAPSSSSSKSVTINGQPIAVPKSGVVNKYVSTSDGTSQVNVYMNNTSSGGGSEVVNFSSN